MDIEQDREDTRGWRPVDTKVLIYVQRRWSVKRIAEKVGLAPRTISQIKNTPDFQKRLREMNEQIANKAAERLAETNAVDNTRVYLQTQMLAAARKLVKLSRKGSTADRLQFEACKEILHLGGLVAKTQIDNKPVEREYSQDEITKALTVLNEVEHTMKRLRNTDSQFYLTKDDTSVNEDTLETSTVRQEEGSEGFILP